MAQASFFKITTAMCLMTLLCHCGGSTAGISGSSSTTTDSGSTTGVVVGGNVTAMTVSDGGAQVDLSDLASDAELVMMVFSFNESSVSAAYQVNGSINASVGQPSQLVTSFLDVEDFAEETTEEFHGLLRDWEQNIDEDEALNEVDHAVNHLIRYATVGDTQDFKVLDSFSDSSSYETVTAELKIQNDYFNLYIDERDTASMTDSDLQEIASNFEAVVPLERTLLGNESDVNGDGRFDILLTRVVNGLGGGTGMVTGFFYAIDLFDPSSYALSNYREVFYTFVPDSTGALGSAVSKSFAMENIYPGVFAHEYQHMISFNMHYNENSGSAETGWLNEGLSHLMEDIYSANGNNFMTTTGLENPARISSFLSSVDTCFTCGTSLTQRGGSYLFVRYLYEQAELGNFSNVANGKTLLNRLLNTSNRSFTNVIQVLYGESGVSSDFQSLLGLFGLSVYLSNSDTTTDNRLGFSGVNLRSSQSDNRGTVLNGPSVSTVASFPYTDTLSGSTISFIQADGQTISDSGGSLDFSFSSASEFGGYLIRQ